MCPKFLTVHSKMEIETELKCLFYETLDNSGWKGPGRSLVQSPAHSRGSCEIRLGCSRLYPNGAGKSPKVKSAQPLWAASSIAHLMWKNAAPRVWCQLLVLQLMSIASDPHAMHCSVWHGLLTLYLPFPPTPALLYWCFLYGGMGKAKLDIIPHMWSTESQIERGNPLLSAECVSLDDAAQDAEGFFSL